MNKIIKSFSILTLALATVLSTGAVKAQASEQIHGQWESKIGGKNFIVNGQPLSGWQVIDGRWYYFQPNLCNYMASSKTIQGNYYVDANGIWNNAGGYATSGKIDYTTATGNISSNNLNIQQVSASTTQAVKDAIADGTISYAEFTKIADGRMLELINAHRQVNGVGTLTWDQTLADMSTEKCNHLIKYNYMSHVYKDVSTSWVQSVAWKHHIDGENCLANYSYAITQEGANAMATSMFNQWSTSSGHDKAMLDPDYIKFGFGFAFSNGAAQYASYGTQQFAMSHSAGEPPMPVTDAQTGKTISNPRFDIGGINNIK